MIYQEPLSFSGCGARLYELRKARNMPLQRVADAIGCSKAHLWELEKGRIKRPGAALISRLATFYDTTADYLIEGRKLGDQSEVVARLYGLLSPRDRRIILATIKTMMGDELGDDAS